MHFLNLSALVALMFAHPAFSSPCKVVTMSDEREMKLFGSGHGDDISRPAHQYGVDVIAQGVSDPNSIQGWDYAVVERSGKKTTYHNYFDLDGILSGNTLWWKIPVDTVVIDKNGVEVFSTRQITYRAPQKQGVQRFGRFRGRSYIRSIRFIGSELKCE